MSPLQFIWTLQFQISPILLVGGVARNAAFGAAPIIYYIQGAGFPGISYPGPDITIDDFFAQFVVLPGSDLINNTFGEYPFANQQTAANAVITQPLGISVMMIAPARLPGDYFLKQPIMTGLRNTLQQHNLSGGTYIINTPARVWGPCLMARFRDMTGFESKQVQWRWQFDFVEPLLTLAQAASAQAALIASIGSGQQQAQDVNGNITTSTGQQQFGGAPVIPVTSEPLPDLPENSLGNPTPNTAPAPSDFSA